MVFQTYRRWFTNGWAKTLSPSPRKYYHAQVLNPCPHSRVAKCEAINKYVDNNSSWIQILLGRRACLQERVSAPPCHQLALCLCSAHLTNGPPALLTLRTPTCCHLPVYMNQSHPINISHFAHLLLERGYQVNKTSQLLNINLQFFVN